MNAQQAIAALKKDWTDGDTARYVLRCARLDGEYHGFGYTVTYTYWTQQYDIYVK